MEIGHMGHGTQRSGSGHSSLWILIKSSHRPFLSLKFLFIYFGCVGSSLRLMDSVAVVDRLCCSKICGILVPWSGIKPASPALQGRVLTTGSLGKVLTQTFAKVSTVAKKKKKCSVGQGQFWWDTRGDHGGQGRPLWGHASALEALGCDPDKAPGRGKHRFKDPERMSGTSHWKNAWLGEIDFPEAWKWIHTNKKFTLSFLTTVEDTGLLGMEARGPDNMLALKMGIFFQVFCSSHWPNTSVLDWSLQLKTSSWKKQKLGGFPKCWFRKV